MKNCTILSNILSALLCLAFTSSCSQNTSSADAPTPQPTDAKKVEVLTFQKKYELEGYGGCGTQEQIFSASSVEEANSKYCDGLQDGERNNYCAESERLDAFIKDCPSRTWNPHVKGDFFNRENPYDLISNGGENLFKTLSHMKAVSILPVEGITDSERKTAYLAFDSFKSCGFEHTCFDSLKDPDYGILYKQVRWSPENVDTLVITLGVGRATSGPLRSTHASDPKYFVLIKKSLDDQSNLFAEIWEASQPVGFRSYKEFFNHSTSVKQLATFAIKLNK